MSDLVWTTYFPELPKKQPELRTVLINIHRHALRGRPLNRGDAKRMVEEQFDVSPGAAEDWLDLLEGRGKNAIKVNNKKIAFVVRVRRPDDKKSIYLVPSSQAKIGLFAVGQHYMACLQLVSDQLHQAMRRTTVDLCDLEWLDEIKAILKEDVIDYETRAWKDDLDMATQP